jgi:hypothetical protein
MRMIININCIPLTKEQNKTILLENRLALQLTPAQARVLRA